MNRHPLSAMIALPFFAGALWAQGTTFRDAAAKAALNVGMASSSRQVSGTGSYATLAKTLNMMVCENDMKFQSTEPSQGKFSYSGGDGMYSFCAANGMRLRGHNFVWHAQSGWAANVNGSREEMLAIMKKHIDSVGGHFKGKVIEWDVLNEITNDGGSGGNNGLRASFWQKTIGNDYPDSAFVFAHRADPYAKLYYNDYGADGGGSKATSMLNLAKKWIQNKIPIHGIGLQCHLSSPVNKKAISDNIKAFGDLGLRISLTEIDIKGSTTQDWTNLMGACLENWNCVSFVTWGIYDGSTWLGGDCNGCLPYDSQYKAKACVQAMIDQMNAADPAIVAKRKDLTKDDISVAIAPLPRALRRAANGSVLGGAVPFFTDGTGLVDALGRDRSIAPNSPWAAGLSVSSAR